MIHEILLVAHIVHRKSLVPSKLVLNYLYNFQIHPGALKQGGFPLVSSCITAAEQASVSGNALFEVDGNP